MENKLFGAVKLEDLNQPATPQEEKPAEAPEESKGVSEEPKQVPEEPKPEEAPKMGEQKEPEQPAEIIVPNMPGNSEKKSDEQTASETAFKMDMMVEAEEAIDASKGIFSSDQPTAQTVKPIESANTWHDNTDFKTKTATHAEKVFETDQSIREEQEEKKKEEETKAAEEEGAKRANKAWGVGTADTPTQEKPAEDVAPETPKEAAPAPAEEQSKSAPVTPEERTEPAPVGIFSAGPKKSSSGTSFFAKIKAVLSKPVGGSKKK